MKFSTAILSLLSLAAVSLAAPHGSHGHGEKKNSTQTGPSGPKVSGPVGNSSLSGPDETPGSGGDYNVLVDNDDPRSLDELLGEMGLTRADLKYVYDNSAYKGFSASLSTHCVGRLSTISGFKVYEPEVQVQLHDTRPLNDTQELSFQKGTWGLKRVSQGQTVLKGGKDVAATDFQGYAFEGEADSLGKGVDIYIVDTGVDVNHSEFNGRATAGFAIDGNPTDDEGHGTHCAGTAASTNFGLAKAANIIDVKVFSGTSTTISNLLAGLNYVIGQHKLRKMQADFRGSVVSMSLGSNVTSAVLESAVEQASAQGIHFSIAAGNDGKDACNTSPAAASSRSDVLTVGAVNVLDQRSSFSNFGRCVSVYAPGEAVTSTFPGNSKKTLSGTSMACPHVTGLIAYFIGLNPSLMTDTAAMKAKIISTARKIELVQNAKTIGDPGILVNNGIVSQ